MVERKLFKTKLCMLYQKGRCSRQSCSFAHGNAELRRFSGSYNGRQNYRGGDLREKLDHRHSPLDRRHSPLERRHSPLRVRDARGRRAVREHSSSRSLERLSDKKRRKRQLDDQSDISGSLKISDRSGERVKEEKVTSSTTTAVLEQQLEKVLSDINMVEHQKYQVVDHLEEKIQEVDTLTSRIQELESQLYKEKEEYNRITSKIKKFVKVHNRHSRIQDELNRSQTRLKKLGDQLGSDVSGIIANGEDSSINIVSDGETTGLPVISSHSGLQRDSSPSKKRLLVNEDAAEQVKQDAGLTKGYLEENTRLKRLSRWNVHPAQSYHDNKAEAVESGINASRPLVNEGKHKKGTSLSNSITSANKLRGLDFGVAVPSTSMAAHADEEVDIELEGKIEVVALDFTTLGNEKETAYAGGLPFHLPPPPPIGFPFHLPPPPPIAKTNYSRYEDEDQNVDVEDLEADMTPMDIV